MSQIECRMVDMSKVVLLVEREEVAPVYALAMRPLDVKVVSSVPDARALAKDSDGLVIVGFPSARVPAKQRVRFAPAEYEPVRRWGVARKPVGQLEIARVLSEVSQRQVLLQPLECEADTANIAGRVRKVGVLELAVAQLQPEFEWTDRETEMVLSYLQKKELDDVADDLGLHASTVRKHLSHATEAARQALGLDTLLPAGLRAWVLRRMLGVY